MPITLLTDATNGASAYADLTALARSMQATRPCYARQIQRIARQLNSSLTAAAAIAAWTETPYTPTILSESTLAESTITESTLVEKNQNDNNIH